MVERILITVLAVFGLSGCYGGNFYSTTQIQQTSQEILDGTIRNPEDWSDEPSRSVRRVAKVSVMGADRMEVGSIAVTPPSLDSQERIAWEQRENERLKSRMQICRSC